MGRSSGTSPSGRRSPPPKAGPNRAALRLLALAATVLVLAGFPAVVAAFAPWWYTSTSSAGTSSTAYFLPGSSIYAGGGGGGGFTSYAAYGAASVGVLYLVVLVGTVALALVCWSMGAYGLGAALRRWSVRPARRGAGAAVAVALGLATTLAVLVPVLQPVLFRSDNPSGACTASPAAGPCRSFWGTTHAGGESSVWGAGAGWWLDVASAVLVALALVAWASAVRELGRSEDRPEVG